MFKFRLPWSAGLLLLILSIFLLTFVFVFFYFTLFSFPPLLFLTSLSLGQTSYVKGKIYLPVYGPITTTECRLISGGYETEDVQYDHLKYEEQLFYHNTRSRTNRFFISFDK